MTIEIPRRVTGLVAPQFDIINARAAALRQRGADVISLGQAVPGFRPPAVALEAAASALADGDTHIYSADAGLPELRETLCRRLASQLQVSVDPQREMIITAGANQALLLALLTLLEPDDEVVLPSPYFMNHEMAVRAVGAVPIEAPLPEDAGFALHLADLEPFLTPRTRAVVVVSPNNPTGAVYSPGELEKIGRAMLARGICVLADETYMHFVYETSRHYSLASLPGWRDGVLVCGSFSKSFAMTGWRAGYLIAPPEVITEALKIQDAMIICAPVITQKAVLAAVAAEWDYPLQFMSELSARRRYVGDRLKEIPSLSWHPTEGGFFAFVRVAGCEDTERLAMDVLDRVHVVTIPGNFFGRSGHGFLRLSYGSVDIPALGKAFDRLQTFFSQHKSSP